MHDKIKLNLWLIRIYAAVIIIVALFDILEGAALKLTMSIAAFGVIVQSYFIMRKNDHESSN